MQTGQRVHEGEGGSAIRSMPSLLLLVLLRLFS